MQARIQPMMQAVNRKAFVPFRPAVPVVHQQQIATTQMHEQSSGLTYDQLVTARNVIVAMGRRSDKIAARKGKSDAKKAKIYGRIGKKIITMVKAGGPDPTSNTKLADVLKMAKDLNVPKDIIERNIKRASDNKQADYQEICYEAYGPGGTGFVVECLTDNVNRTASEVKAAITKSGCKVAEPGSVMFNFQRAGLIFVKNTSEDAVFEASIEAGADDVVAAPSDEDVSTSYKVYTTVEAYISAKATLAGLGFQVDEEESGLVYRAAAPVEVDDAAFQTCEALVDRLIELDDVDGVYSNCDGLEI